MNKKDTYYAHSTPVGVSATATIRISGPAAFETVSGLTNKPIGFFKHKKANVLSIYNKNNILVDKCVIVCFMGPRSYTGENVVEIHSHGNPTIVKNIFNCLSSLGLRIANPGEFTKTAYLNNKIDLVQAEAVFNLINSKTAGGVGISLNNLGGSLSKRFLQIQKKLIYTLSLVEYELDISDTDTLKKTKKVAMLTLKEILRDTKELIKTHSTAKVISDGSRIVIVGKPNVGKSTLFNALLNYDRSIVTSEAGTTRDVIEESRSISGHSIVVVDTAGIRETKNRAETAGVEKTRAELRTADMVISVIDPVYTKPKFNINENTPQILVCNKKDLLSKKQIETLCDNKKVALCLSAKTKEGVDELLAIIKKKLELNPHPKDGFYITSKRQEDILISINKSLSKLSRRQVFELEIFSFEIKSAIERFDWLLGKTTPDDVLDKMFSQFCVGK